LWTTSTQPTFSGTLAGVHSPSPSRGFLPPISGWNRLKHEEWKEREIKKKTKKTTDREKGTEAVQEKADG